MKRLSLVIAATLLMVGGANAQFFKYGIKGGVNSSNISIDKTTISIPTIDGAKNFIIEQGNSKLGFHFGLFTRIQVVGLFIQPELIFTQSKGEFVFSEQEALNVTTLTSQKFNKFDIPIMVGWKFGPARIGLGPVASFTLGEKDGLQDKITTLAGEANNVDNAINKAVFGYQVGVGLDILKTLTFDVRYEGNLSKLGDSINIGTKEYSFDQRNPQWIFSLGIFF
ncbi:MAG: porin family protein [Tenuifilaceae bacterium]|nr:porin family protein [Tenuifilaceae bacterium]